MRQPQVSEICAVDCATRSAPPTVFGPSPLPTPSPVDSSNDAPCTSAASHSQAAATTVVTRKSRVWRRLFPSGACRAAETALRSGTLLSAAVETYAFC